MRKIVHVALREFLATAATRAFLFAVLFPPAISLLMALLVLPWAVKNERAPRVEGRVAVRDPTGMVAIGLTVYLSPEALAKRWDERARRLDEELPAAMKGIAGSERGGGAPSAIRQSIGEVPRIDVRTLPSSANLETEKARLDGPARRGERDLALVDVAPDAVALGAGRERYGSYELYLRPKLDDRIEREIRDGLREAIVAARVRSAGLDRARLEALFDVSEAPSRAVSRAGRRTSEQVLGIALPAAFTVLLFMAVMVSAQGLMTTTLEEKTTRVAEVLLSAVSPMELMAGKIAGQMACGLLILLAYSALGLTALISFSLAGLLDWSLLVYLLIFFLITYCTLGSCMAAIGAAVNDLREAQTLLMPLVLLMIVPYMLVVPLSRAPNSALSIAISFLPLMNGFGMLMRAASTSPPPAWQIWTSIGVGAATAYGALWCASKVFRIGMLMHGKAPNLATLVRWIRAT